jgi:hypothetical protein
MRSVLIDGWRLEFRKNVHMYCHYLRLSKAGLVIEPPCEDMVIDPKTMGVWLEDLGLNRPTLNELSRVLQKWVSTEGFRCRIYLDRDNFIPSPN